MPTVAANRVAIALIVVCQSTQALAFGGIALFLPLIRDDVDLTFSQAGTLAGAATLVYALMQVPAGYLADRFGARRLFVTGLVGTNLLSLAFALLHSYPLLLVNQAASGFFRSLLFAPGMLLIAAHFPPGRRASALGLYVAGGFSSNILLSSLGPAVVGDVGWRFLFVAFSVLGLLAVAAYAALPPPPPRAAGSPVRLRELWPLLREPVLRLAGVVQFVRLAVVTGLGFWLPTYLVVDKGFSLQAAGLVVALGAALTAPANILGGYVSDRLGRPLLVIGVSLVMLGATLALLVTARAAVAVVVLVGVNAVFLQVYFGPLFQVPIQVLGERTAGLTSGVSNFCANVGGFAAASALGAVKDASGSFAPGLLALAVLCGVGLAATSALRSRTGPAASPSPAG